MRLGGLKYSASFFTYDPVRQYALRPGAHGWSEGEGESYVTINSDGMHDREHAVAKPNGVFRVAFLGDSETNAVHLAFEENMVQLAQKELQRDPGNVELLNFAVGGYTLPEQVYTFRDHAAKYQPDVVILMLSPAIIRSSNRELNTFCLLYTSRRPLRKWSSNPYLKWEGSTGPFGPRYKDRREPR